MTNEDCVLLNALRYEVLECTVPTPDPTDAVDGTDDWAHDGVCEVGGEWQSKWAIAPASSPSTLNPARSPPSSPAGLCPGLNDVISS